ncbi:conserved exported protein of unknown function [Pseudomonas sp. JV551A1]|uniref:Uncharacterized protein n=1 Tax=Pseudomonas inefficax TaxID=2078786 RepID=A0AAQ1SSU3_9PSED|nr:hypothetical protein [Pseudomonas]SPO53953.1 conserved exported protein of unknown function [Pseudomonas sp. JV551A1]SPO60192.1 conserved exported protein of unknown function [Pseudomonas inefficax]
MPSIFPSVAVAALFASAPVWAQSTQLADRVMTPSAFLGVDLQGDFMTQVPECAAGDLRPSEPCRVATEKAGRFEVRGLPYLPISPGYKLFATVDGGAVSQLVLTGNANNLYLVKEMLTDKLGQPATSGTHWVKLKSGASYEAEVYKWNSEGVAVDFGRDLSDLGRYSVTFSTSMVGTDMGQLEELPPTDRPSL